MYSAGGKTDTNSTNNRFLNFILFSRFALSCVSACLWIFFCACVLVVSVMSPLSPLIRADCIYIQWQEKVNVAVINSCISIRESEGGWTEACRETQR